MFWSNLEPASDDTSIRNSLEARAADDGLERGIGVLAGWLGVDRRVEEDAQVARLAP